MKRLRWPLLLLMVAAALQWLLPATLVVRSELTLRHGTRYYLRTAPVDPLDPFRGRYVTLSFADARAPAASAERLQYGERVYVPIRTGSDRYALFGAASRTPPASGDYVEAHVAGVAVPGTVSLRLPFDRYYLDEYAAPQAERAYRDASRRDGAREAYVSIRVRNGHAALEELFIDNVPLRRYLRTLPPS